MNDFHAQRFAVFVIFTTLLASTASYAASEPFNDKIAAVVNGEVILNSDIKSLKNPIVKNITSLPLGVIPPGKLPTDRELLEELIVLRILEQEADRKGVTVDDKAVDESVEAIRKRNNMTKDHFILFLAASGLTYQEYVKIMKRQFRLRKLIAGEVTQKIALSEEDAQRYFKEHKGKIDAEFEKLTEAAAPHPNPREKIEKPKIPTHETVYSGGKVRLRQITLRIPQEAKEGQKRQIVEKADRIYKEASTGADFARLAKKYSEDPLAAKGGDLGYMNYSDLVGNVQKMVQRLKEGDVTRPIVTPKAVFIFYLEDAKGRKEQQVPIPEKIRKELQKKLDEAYEKRKARAQGSGAPKDTPPNKKPNVDKLPTTDRSKAKPSPDLGILTPEEKKEYDQQREKVLAILRAEKTESRMKEWIEDLKKNSIIEVRQ
jgi:peptidyl-prolyl cis-trans isomerase SurA